MSWLSKIADRINTPPDLSFNIKQGDGALSVQFGGLEKGKPRGLQISDTAGLLTGKQGLQSLLSGPLGGIVNLLVSAITGSQSGGQGAQTLPNTHQHGPVATLPAPALGSHPPSTEPSPLPPQTTGGVSGAANHLSGAANELDQLADKMKTQTDCPLFKKVETAIDELRAAATQVKENPNNTQALEQLEAAAVKLKDAIKGMEGQMDKGAYQALSQSAERFANTVSQHDAPHIMVYPDRHLENVLNKATSELREVTDNLENMMPSTTGNPGAPSPGTPSPQPTPQPTWEVDQSNRTIQLDNGYSLKFDNANQSWHITDKEGNSTRIWGDPHVQENDGGKWDFKQDATFMLDDGTKISVNTVGRGNSLTVTDSLTITKGDQAILVTGVADNNVKISNVMSNGSELDRMTNDGYVFKEENGVDDWTSNGNVITTNQAMGNPLTHEEPTPTAQGQGTNATLSNQAAQFLFNQTTMGNQLFNHTMNATRTNTND